MAASVQFPGRQPSGSHGRRQCVRRTTWRKAFTEARGYASTVHGIDRPRSYPLAARARGFTGEQIAPALPNDEKERDPLTPDRVADCASLDRTANGVAGRME